MEDIKQIGLNIWGIRGGFRSFCHSENLNIEEPEILTTWKDFRDFVYVSNLSVRFYALEFTTNFKVFTLYRPVNDTSRTGAYVATTLYVPHQLRINNIVDLLKQISDAYYKDHYDAFGNPNTNPEYMPIYQAILDANAGKVSRELKKRTWEGSPQDNMPKVLPYSNIAVVEQFFAEPYRHEFLACQEVMFWDNNFLQNMQTYGVKFLKMESLNDSTRFELDGNDIKEQFNGGRIMNQPNGQLARFVCNGNDITQSWQSAFFDDGDMVEVIVHQPHHNDVVCSGPLAKCGLFKKSGVDYHFIDVNFVPKIYKLMVSAPGVKDATLYFNFDAVQISNGLGFYELKGNQLNDNIRISLRYGNTGFSLKDVNIDALYNASTDSFNEAPIVIEGLKTYRFYCSVPCQGSMEFANKEIAFSTNSLGEFDLVLPSNVEVSSQSLTVKVNGYDVKVESDGDYAFNVQLVPNVFKAVFYVPRELEGYFSNAGFRVTVDGNRFSTTSALSVEIPQRFRNMVRDGKATLELLHGNKALSCKFSVFENNGNELTLKPELQLIQNATDVSMTVQEVTIPAKGKMVWPVRDFALKGDYEIERAEKPGYQLLTLKKKVVVPKDVKPQQQAPKGPAVQPKVHKNQPQQPKGHGGNSDVQKKRLLLYGGIGLGVVLVTLLVLAIVLGWFGGGKKSDVNTNEEATNKVNDVYTVEVKMENGSDIECIKYEMNGTAKVAKGNSFTVDKDCESISIMVETKGEGNCDQIELINKDGKLECVEGMDEKKFSFKQEKAMLLLTSPAWKELNECEDCSLDDYDILAKKYNTSSTFIKKCAQRAFELVDSTDRKSITDYQTLFLFDEAKEFKDKCDGYIGRINEEGNENQDKLKLLKEFKEKLEIVWSMDCTLDAVKNLKAAYEKVKGYDERFDVIESVIGNDHRQKNNSDWFADTFIPYQEKFFGLLNIDDYRKAKTTVENYTMNYKSCFSEGQRETMKKLVIDTTVFNFYYLNRGSIQKGAMYRNIEKRLP